MSACGWTLAEEKVLRQGCEHKWFAWEEENIGCVHEQIIYHRGANWDSTILGPLGGDMEGPSELSYPRVEKAGSVSSDFHLSLSLPGAPGAPPAVEHLQGGECREGVHSCCLC